MKTNEVTLKLDRDKMKMLAELDSIVNHRCSVGDTMSDEQLEDLVHMAIVDSLYLAREEYDELIRKQIDKAMNQAQPW